MVASVENLVWIDLEMTGLDTMNDQIIEIATVVTDKHLGVIAEGPVLAIHQADEVLEAMDDWNKRTHGDSGLLDRVRASDITEAQAERATLEFLRQFVPPNHSPMCGSSICQDRRFLARLMPDLERFFHYRNLDVSTLKELAKRWAPELVSKFEKRAPHVALDDIHESIRELRFYREHFMAVPEA